MSTDSATESEYISLYVTGPVIPWPAVEEQNTDVAPVDNRWVDFSSEVVTRQQPRFEQDAS